VPLHPSALASFAPARDKRDMGTSYNRIAYEALEVCNGVEMAAVEAAVARTGLAAGTRAVDVGTGNAGVAIRMASAFGLAVTAIEYDPVMADLARERIAASGTGDRVTLRLGAAADVLETLGPVDLLTALGTTNVTGEGRPTPEAAMRFLKGKLKPGGWLVWGDLVWIDTPPEPLRQLTETVNLYTDEAGWRAAAEAAGFEVVSAEISSQAVFDGYAAAADRAARDWLVANPSTPEAEGVRASADRVKAILTFGRPFIGFGLYLLRA
jgi:precorrin-6B methylase 2